MTICDAMKEAVKGRLDEKKSLEQIGLELCGGVKNPKGKAMRVIKEIFGKDYLVKNADWLGYDTKKAEVGKAGAVSTAQLHADVREPTSVDLPKFISAGEEPLTVEKTSEIASTPSSEEACEIPKPPESEPVKEPPFADWAKCPNCGKMFDPSENPCSDDDIQLMIGWQQERNAKR